jgi:hypothetical protein
MISPLLIRQRRTRLISRRLRRRSFPWCQRQGLFLEEDAFWEGTIGKIDMVVKSNSSCVILRGQIKPPIFLLTEKMELPTSFHMDTKFPYGN